MNFKSIMMVTQKEFDECVHQELVKMDGDSSKKANTAADRVVQSIVCIVGEENVSRFIGHPSLGGLAKSLTRHNDGGGLPRPFHRWLCGCSWLSGRKWLESGK